MPYFLNFDPKMSRNHSIICLLHINIVIFRQPSAMNLISNPTNKLKNFIIRQKFMQFVCKRYAFINRD
jgi:hypothetical protein